MLKHLLISGVIEFFLRAYVEVLFVKAEFEFVRLKLFEFNIPFERPSFLATQSGDTLTLAIGPNSSNRIQGDLNDIAESIFVSGNSGTVKVWSPQFNRDVGNEQTFDGITKIIAFGGAGDDVIDLSGLLSSVSTEIHGGDGNDTIKGGAGADTFFGDGGSDTLIGNGGADILDGGDGTDALD